MIKYTNADKTLVVPSGLGNFGQSSGSGGGVTPQQAAEIASAVTEAAIDEYDTELQVELEEIREAISGNTDTLLDLATIAAMSIAERVALFDEIFEKASNGEKIYIKGLVQEETIRTAILPLVSYRPETNPVLHQGGYLYFAAKGDTDNVYFHVALSSEGQIDPTSGNIIKRNIYNLPTASAEVKGGVRIGSGLTMTQDTLSLDTTGIVTDGDLAPFIVQQSANTQNIASLSAATEAISDSLGNYATTADTNELATAISGVSDSLANYATTATTDALSAVTSALTESVAGKQDTLSAGNGIDLSGNTISVKIGEGLAFSGNTLVVSGGSDEQNYVIVDSLSEITEPYAGLEAYRREYTESVVYTGYTIDASQVDENYAAHIYYDGQNEVAVYHNGGGFHWDWDNESAGSLRKREDFYYTINGERTIMSVFFNNPDAYVTFEEGVTTAATSTTISTFHRAVTYRYNGNAWEEYQPPKAYYLDKMTQQELVALYNEISQYSELTFPAGNYRFFITNEGNDEYQGRFEIFVARFYGGSNVCFSGVMQSRYNNTLLQRGYELSSSGELYNNFSENKTIPDAPYKYDMFPEDYGNYSDGGSFTGVSQEYWANVWESSKSESFTRFAKKTLYILINEGDVVPFRFKLAKTSGSSQDESTMVLYFTGQSIDYDTNTITVRKFSLTKNVNDNIYITSALATSTYTASS